MWEEYWKVYFHTTADACYYDRYAVSASRKNGFISALCLIASSSSAIFLVSPVESKTIWTIILIIAQLVTIIRPVFPFEKRRLAANYIAKELHNLSTELRNNILEFTQETPDERFMELIREARKRNEEIQFRFADADTFPKRQKLMNKAQIEAYQLLGGHIDDTK